MLAVRPISVTLISALLSACTMSHHIVATTSFSSSPRTCAVLQSAYTTAIGYTTPAFPADVRMSPYEFPLGHYHADFWMKLGISERDHHAFAEQGNRYRERNFKPHCMWRGVQGPTMDDEGHPTYVTFSTPIFLPDGQTALAEVFFREEGLFAYGMMCVVRHTRSGWTSQCRQNWIT